MRGWRRFDAYAKAVEGIQERTIGGGIITLLSFLFVFFLFISEVSVWWTVNVLHRMHVDTMPVGYKSLYQLYDLSKFHAARISHHIRRRYIHAS